MEQKHTKARASAARYLWENRSMAELKGDWTRREYYAKLRHFAHDIVANCERFDRVNGIKRED